MTMRPDNAPDLNFVKGAVDGAFGNSRTTRFFVNMGQLDGFNIHSLKDFLSEAVKLHPRMVFNLDVKSSFSFFETESKFVDAFMALNSQDIEFNGRKVSLEVSNRKMHDGERRGGGSKGGFKGGEREGKRPRKPGAFGGEKTGYPRGEKKKGFGKSRF
jgi:ATP-dependent RNA helicase DeaD